MISAILPIRDEPGITESGGESMGIPILCYFCGEPITKLNGKDSDSLVNHHITYIPEQVWITRRERHGPSGGNEKALETRRKNDPNHKWAYELWKKRRERYGPTGMKPK